MSSKCEICGKTPANGNRVSHANNRTKRRWMPNLQTVRILKPGGNRKKLECAPNAYVQVKQSPPDTNFPSSRHKMLNTAGYCLPNNRWINAAR